MHAPPNKPAAGAWIALLNAIPNVFWSVLCIAPVYVFCDAYVGRPWLYGFAIASALAYAIPASLFRYIQLSKQPAAYRSLRVAWVNRVTQNGALVNKLARRHGHTPNRLATDPQARKKLTQATYERERFHLAALCFFLFITFYALPLKKPGWAAALLLLNILYNLYPIWLQQYIRIRLHRLRA